MTWARFEDRFPWHRKIRPLSDAAFRLHVSAVCWSNEHLTDGRIPADDLALVSDVKAPAKAVRELVARTVWDEADGGWQLHDFLIYNESRDTITLRREADAERKRKGREGRTPKGSPPGVRADVQRDSAEDSHQDSHAESPRESVRPGPSRPEPTTEPAPQVLAAGKPPPTRRTRVPDSFPITADLADWGREHAPAVDGNRETEQWLDYHRAKGDLAKDWAASWRTWMRRAQQDAERRPTPGRGLAVVRPSQRDAAVAQVDAAFAAVYGRDAG